jgi:hypothetical protein
MGNFSDQSSRENKNRHFMFNNSFSESRAVYEMWKNIGDDSMEHAHCMPDT